MRADLHAIVQTALAGLPQAERTVHRQDRGDGIRLILPATVSPHTVIHPFLPDLAAALREHRKAAAPAARLRLRVAVHMGLLYRDAHGWAGAPLVHCARLLDAAPVRHALSATPHTNLIVAVSETIYRDVVRHAYGVDPTTYQQTTITEKETTATAWIHLPGQPTPREPTRASQTSPPQPQRMQ